MKTMLKTFSLLSDETKTRILNIVSTDECCVCEVMKALEITQSAASRGLTALHEAGFLDMRKDGLWSLYSISANIPPYQSELIKIIKRELQDDPAAMRDRERLAEARSTSPRAASIAVR